MIPPPQSMHLAELRLCVYRGGHLGDQGGMRLTLAILDSCCPENLGNASQPGQAIVKPRGQKGALGFLRCEARLIEDQ